MKRFVALVLVILCWGMAGALGQGLDDDYVQIFRLIQEADALTASAPSQALAKYLDAQSALDRLHKGSPDWNTRIVNYRLSYLAGRIAALSASTVPPSAAQTTESNSPQTAVAPKPGQAQAPSNWQDQLNGLNEQVRQLQSEKQLLEAKLKEALAMRPAAADPAELAKAEDRIKTLQKENELLKVSIDKEKQSPAPSVDVKALEAAQRSLADANRQLAEQSARVSALTLEKVALENRLKENAAGSNAAAGQGQSGQSERIKQLEDERAGLQKRLDEATRVISARKGKASAGQVQELENQLALARTRLEIFEARAVPYSAEELELMKRPQTKLVEADPKTGKKSIKELPPGSAALVAEAQRYFAAREYDKAEAAYQQVLQQDQKNVPTLANLAAIQVEAQEFDKAEGNVKRALAVDPEDGYCLYVLGILRFRQAKYDDALDALSHSAKIDPQNAEVQNYLGMVLSEKGMRIPAEAALRKAIQLQPGNAGAHYNLAVVYATQQPPATELARWHYDKAIAAGHPRNPDLEKKFEARP